MDQQISCQDIYCIYKHPLSILIHLKFQDKDGCSRNGSRELLFNLILKNRGNIDKFLRYATMDSRGVPLDLGNNGLSCIDSDDERIILGFKQLKLSIDSQFPIVQEEREAMTYLLNEISEYRFNKISDILDNPSLDGHKISSVCGHVIGVHSPYCEEKFTSSNHSQLFSSLTQFQHLRSLQLRISKSWDHQERFYEELGDQFGSKLVHLEVWSYSEDLLAYASPLRLLSKQMVKFSSLKKLKLNIHSWGWRPSFNL